MADEVTTPRRTFLQACGLIGVAVAAEGLTGASRELAAAVRVSRPGPDDPPIPNEIVQRIFDERFQGRPIILAA